jgi:subfamily B ATP-binding cassette protein HlyB/CyaB
LARQGFRSGEAPAFGFRWFLPSLWRFRRPLGNVLVASFFVQLLALATPLLFQVVIDKVLVHKSGATLALVFTALAVLGFFYALLQYLRASGLAHTTNRVDVELGSRLFRHLLRLPLGYFETRAAGQTVARMREVENIRAFLTSQGLSSVMDLLFAFVFLAVLLFYSWQLTLVVVASIPLYLLIAGLLRPALRDMIKEKFNRGAASQQFLVEAVIGIQTLKASAIEPVMLASWEEKLAAYVKTAYQATQLAAVGQNAIQYTSALTTAFLLLFGAKAVIDGDMTVGELVAFNMIAAQLTQPVLRLSQLFQDFQQVRVSVDRLGDILNTPMEPSPASQTSPPPPKGAIAFQDVNFRYRPGEAQVLSNISLAIRPGEVIGIVGASGSGKSTLTKLLQRFYQPESGRILVDGLDIAALDPAWLRRHIGVVLQENVLFNRTAAENLSLADPSLPRAAVIRFAELSGAHEFIAKLPQGYDTVIEERGANLSGGQRQRIAIARALATNPRILILDEATSALDYESERLIQDNMRAIIEGRTVIVVAHRLSTIRDCHRIVAMKDGRVAEIGSHAELLANEHGVYSHLWGLQNGTRS